MTKPFGVTSAILPNNYSVLPSRNWETLLQHGMDKRNS